MKDSLPFFVFLLVPFWVVFVRSQECNLTGECIDSDVVAEYYTDTEKDCLKACKETTNCAWFTFVESADFCFLFSECKKLSNATCFDCISGEVTCPDTDCGLIGICEGHKLTIHQGIDSNNGCLQVCKNEENCTWISYNSIENLCITYSTCEMINDDLEEFISSEIQCLPSKPKFSKISNAFHFLVSKENIFSAKLLVVIGDAGLQPHVKTEVIDLVDPNVRCNDLGWWRKGLYGTLGGLLQYDNGTYLPIVCPQDIESVSSNIACWAIKPFDFLVTLQLQDRRNAAATILNNVAWANGTSLLWITGGATQNGFQTTEIVRPDPISYETEFGPELPINTSLASHCTITVEDSVYFIGGGNNSLLFNQVLIYNYTSNEWLEGPSMKIARKDHACVHYKDSQDNSKIMVTGGSTALKSYISSVEILDLDSQTWSFGTYLPNALSGHAMIAIEDTVYVIGGEGPNGLSGDIYHCIGGFSCQWELYSTKLQMPRKQFTAMLVPDELCFEAF